MTKLLSDKMKMWTKKQDSRVNLSLCAYEILLGSVLLKVMGKRV